MQACVKMPESCLELNTKSFVKLFVLYKANCDKYIKQSYEWLFKAKPVYTTNLVLPAV